MNIDSLKPTLLMDVAMNNYSQKIFSVLQKYDKMLPEGLRMNYYILKYKDIQQRFFKRFFRICRNASIMTDKGDFNGIALEIMDNFEATIMPYVEKVDDELRKFLEPDTNDPDNIALLKNIQMNNVLLQMAEKMNVIYIGKKDSMLNDLLDINKMFIARLDDREHKKDYNIKEIQETLQELVYKVRDYEFDMDSISQEKKD